jgi:hypothetical protein
VSTTALKSRIQIPNQNHEHEVHSFGVGSVGWMLGPSTQFCLSVEDFVQDQHYSAAYKFMIKRVCVELQRCNAQHLSEVVWFTASSTDPLSIHFPDTLESRPKQLMNEDLTGNVTDLANK